MGDAVKKTILFVNHSLAMGGIERMICDFADSLPRDEFNVHAAVFEAGGVLEETLSLSGIPVHHLDKKEGLDFGLVKRLAALTREIGADVIHSNNYSAWLYSVLASKFGGTGVCVHTEHSNVDSGEKRRYVLEWILSHWTHFVVSVSEMVRMNLIERARIDTRRIRYVPNGIDTVQFSSSVDIRHATREELGLADDEVVVGAIGRLVPVKNHGLLLDAFSRALGKGVSLRLMIIGEGPERELLEETVGRLGLGSQVILTGERQDVDVLLNAMDIYVLSSLSEGMSLSLLEAMSMGLPIIATAVGGSVDLVQEQNGILVPSGDAEAMKDAIIRLASDFEARKRMGQASRASVLEHYSKDAMVKHYCDIYRNATEVRSR